VPAVIPMLPRRNLLSSTATRAAGALASPALAAAPVAPAWRVTNKRIRQSVMGWCFKPMSAVDLARACKDIGLVAMEGISSKDYPAVRERGLNISLVGSHGFKQGPCDPKHRDMCIAKLKASIDLAAQVNCPSVITFTGMRVDGLTDAQQDANCVDVWKAVIQHAEAKKINLVLEHLNSRDDTHPMKGHPGYYGDHVDHCVDLIRKVDSPNMKLLFDVYHVQIMDGDLIRRIKEFGEIIGHVHTAGNPGRNELDDTQEIQYGPVMKALLEIGYKGFVGHEFIPTRDPETSLREAIAACDV